MKFLLLLWAGWFAQEPPPKPLELLNTGKPMLLAMECQKAEINEHGLDCSEDEPCPVFLELTSIETVGTNLFATGNLHAESATLWSVFLASEDEGKTWTEPYPRRRSTALDLLQFVDPEVGFAAGHDAGPLLRDPFLLKTTDGGKTWKREPVFEDGRVGVVDTFWFDTRDRGFLVIDRMQSARQGRYQRYETTNAGGNWMLREVSAKPIATKRPKGGSNNPDWRLRTDAPSKTYRIERRAEGRWSPVASFNIRAGACKP